MNDYVKAAFYVLSLFAVVALCLGVIAGCLFIAWWLPILIVFGVVIVFSYRDALRFIRTNKQCDTASTERETG